MPAAGRILPLLWVILLLAGCGTWDSAADGALRDGDDSLGRRKLREALGHFRQAVAQAPASAAAHARRGAVAEVLGELDEAMDAYYEAARREPSALAYYRVGALAARMGATDGGVQWLSAGRNPIMVRELATGVYVDKNMAVPLDNTDSYADDLPAKYWASVRRLIRVRLAP